MSQTQFQPIKKGSVGQFEYWLAGKMRWEIRKHGELLAIRANLSDAAGLCSRLHSLDKA